jgi:hypothetical protein
VLRISSTVGLLVLDLEYTESSSLLTGLLSIGGGSVQLIYLLIGALQFKVLSNLMSLFVWSLLVGFFRRLNLGYVQIAVFVCTVLLCVHAVLTATVFQEVTWAPYKATQQVQGRFDVFIPNDPSADYVVRQFGVQGAGKIRVSMQAKSDRPQTVNFTLLQFGSGIRFDQPCFLKTIETVCEITGAFSDRLAVGGAFGSFQKSEWKRGDSRILVGRFEMEYLEPPSLRSYLQNIPRVRSVFFNENAFGAVSALLALVSWFVFNRFFGVLLVVLNLVSITLSGSQNALLGLLAAALVIIVFSRARLMLALVTILLVVVFVFGPNPFSSFRIFNASPGERNLERVEIWSQYVRSGLASSLIFGRGVLDVPGFGTTIKAQHGHNLWVQSFYQGGILGLTGMFLLWLVAFWKGIFRFDIQRISMLICILVLNLFDFTFYFWPVQVFFWSALIGWKFRA